MKTQVLAALAAMLVLCDAAPLPATSEALTGAVLFDRATQSQINDCGASTFVNQSSGGSPLISDCQMIARNIAGGGSWTIGCGGSATRTYARYGTCAVDARCDGDSTDAAYIGNQDTIDIINSSIQKFSYQGKVGATGRMGCDSINVHDMSRKVIWGKYFEVVSVKLYKLLTFRTGRQSKVVLLEMISCTLETCTGTTFRSFVIFLKTAHVVGSGRWR
ncbi:hypothetical protein VTL71DRAFT_9964 [Oculimacula yallundae]|uniref:Ecp2 effector protein-like domain-containing protein n=1 Tax=Oculimacula yallundae TaxID=86028 RepID=A0ABR4BR22_9HELO